MDQVTVRSNLKVFPGEAKNVCNQGAECRLGVMGNRYKRCMRRNECKVQRTVDGEIAIMVKMEW